MIYIAVAAATAAATNDIGVCAVPFHLHHMSKHSNKYIVFVET